MFENPTAIGSQRYSLRQYQLQLLNETRSKFGAGARRVLAVAPTGSGKTIAFCSIIDGAMSRGKRCLVLTHRREITEQTSDALAGFGIAHGMILSGAKATPTLPVQVASIPTLIHKLDVYSNFDLVFIDEAHHSTAPTWRRIIGAMPQARVLGLTATPERTDGAGLGDVFEEMVLGPTTAELIADGFLSPFTAYAPVAEPDLSGISTRAGDFAADQLSSVMTKPVVIDSAIDAYTDHAEGRRAVVFGVDVKHSQALAERFRDAGVAAVHLDGETPRDERRRILAALATGEIRVVTNCGLISEGVDIPAIDAVLLARPTQSTGLYLQQVGRALRIAPNKDRAIILDLVGNIGRHGLPDAPREWSLDAKPRRQRKPSVLRPRTCEACATINKPLVIKCERCGTMLVTPVEQVEIRAEIRRIDQQRISEIRKMEYSEAMGWAGASMERLRMVALARGYKPGWVRYALEEAA